MKPVINITTSNNCKLYIEDKSQYSERSGEKDKFSYSDTISIVTLRHNKLNESLYKDVIIAKHTNNKIIEIPVNIDGYFQVVYLVLPTKDWVDSQLEREGSLLKLYDFVYYSDGMTIYKYCPKTEDTPIAVSPDEILDLNLDAGSYTIYKIEQKYISICFLKECYINLCQQIFNNRGFSSCWNKSNVDSELVYKRDLVWMTINVIKYLAEREQLVEIERIIETIQGCNGLCVNSTTKSNGCGCSKG